MRTLASGTPAHAPTAHPSSPSTTPELLDALRRVDSLCAACLWIAEHPAAGAGSLRTLLHGLAEAAIQARDLYRDGGAA